MYDVIKAVYAINDFAKITKGRSIRPVHECLEPSDDQVYYNENTMQIVSGRFVGCGIDIVSYYDDIGSGSYRYEAIAMLYKNRCGEEIEYLKKHPKLSSEAYICLKPKEDNGSQCTQESILNGDALLYIYDGEVYTNEIYALEKIESKCLD